MVVGAIVGFYLLLVTGTVLHLLISIGLMAPLVADGLMQAFNLRKSNNTLRFITGVLFPIGLTQIGFSFARLVLQLIR